MARFTGTTGDDRVRGGLEEDNIFLGFGRGADVAVGGNRTDRFQVTALDDRTDHFHGGAGRDGLDLGRAALPLRTVIRLDDGRTAGSITAPSNSLPDPSRLLAALHDIEDVTGTGGDDRIYGNGEANRLLGGGGDDLLAAGRGNDTLSGGAGDDTLVATLDRRSAGGEDTLDGGADRDTLAFAPGGAGFLGVVVSLSTEFAPSLIGVPTPPPSIDEGFVASRFANGTGQISIRREAAVTGIEDAVGTAGDDTLIGDRRGNSLWGGGGSDLLSGETGADVLDGGAGDDVFESYADDALDLLTGGAGIDTVSYARASKGVIVTLADGEGVGGTSVLGSGSVPTFVREDELRGIENVTGSRLNDRIQGNAEANLILGGRGGDVLLGLGGDDLLDGGTGVDTLVGRAGADIFRVWDSGSGAEADTIRDFLSGTDRLDLSGFFSRARENHLSPTPLAAPTFIGSGAFSGEGGAELRILRSGGESRVQVDFGDGTLGALDLEVRLRGPIAIGDIVL